MKKFIYLLLVIPLFLTSCEDDDQRCATCQAGYTFEVCELENGNASWNGEDLQMDYDEYIELLDCN